MISTTRYQSFMKRFSSSWSPPDPPQLTESLRCWHEEPVERLMLSHTKCETQGYPSTNGPALDPPERNTVSLKSPWSLCTPPAPTHSPQGSSAGLQDRRDCCPQISAEPCCGRSSHCSARLQNRPTVEKLHEDLGQCKKNHQEPRSTSKEHPGMFAEMQALGACGII